MNLPLQLDRSSPMPLQDQLFEKLRQLILSGRLKPNTRVIATRFLAEQAGVSRRTVLFAYERLIAEGYLETRPAIGTFVSPTPPGQAKRETANTAAVDVPRQATLYPPSLRAPAKPGSSRSSHRIDFSCQHQDSSLHLPQKVWLRWMREVLMVDPGIFSNPGPVAGAETLRKVIATYLGATRGVLASPEQVVIVSGRRQAASLVSHLFQRAGDKVIVEAPGDQDIGEFFRLRRAELVGVPVDEFGLDVEALPQGNAALAYVTPSRQNPVGGAIPQERRTQLIDWARNAGAYIIEDDSDCELRYFGAAPLPLTAMDPYGLVFYIGSFSKTLGAGLNLGYLVVPPEFVGDILAIKAMAGESGQYFEQMVVANLLASGEYDHHLRRLRKVYLERRDSLISTLKTYFGAVELFGAEAGTQMTWLLPPHFPSASQICEAAAARGVYLAGVVDPAAQTSRFYERALILCYAALTVERMEEGISILSSVLGGLRA